MLASRDEVNAEAKLGHTIVEDTHAVVEGVRGKLCLYILHGGFDNGSVRQGGIFDQLRS